VYTHARNNTGDIVITTDAQYQFLRNDYEWCDDTSTWFAKLDTATTEAIFQMLPS